MMKKMPTTGQTARMEKMAEMVTKELMTKTLLVSSRAYEGRLDPLFDGLHCGRLLRHSLCFPLFTKKEIRRESPAVGRSRHRVRAPEGAGG